MTLTKKFKNHVTDFVIRLGPLQTTGALIGVRQPEAKPKGTKIVSCTPEGKPVKQVYVPADDPKGEQYTMGELGRATLNADSTLTLLSKDALAEAKEPVVPKDTMAVTIHPLDEVEDQLFPSDNNAYVFEPHTEDDVNLQWYTLLYEALKRAEGKAFIGSANVRNSEGLYRLTLWRDRIILQRMLYPEELNDHQPLNIDAVDETIVEKFVNKLDKLTKDFDPDKYRDSTKDRIAAVQAAFAAGDVTFVPIKKEQSAGFDILDAIEAFDEN
jgi:non-homologous end joining protein Ku